MFARKIDYLMKEVERCLLNTNAMLEEPMVGYLTAKSSDDEGHAEVYLLGVSDHVVYYRTQDGVEHEVNIVIDDVFDLFDLVTIGRFCDAVSSVY